MLAAGEEKFSVMQARINSETMRGGAKQGLELADEMKWRDANLPRDFRN